MSLGIFFLRHILIIMSAKENLTIKNEFKESDKNGVYRAIYSRRDIRGQFHGDTVSEEVLSRILHAAHHAPSVGFMQPWNFILIKNIKIRRAVHEAFKHANSEATLMFSEDKRGKYQKFKLEGILESPLNICITCDRNRFGPTIIGRTTNPNMDMFSSVCAVHNLWLAARAEGLGVGWVSIIHNKELSEILCLPKNIVPVAYLCVGYVTHFPPKPELESAGWLPRLSLEKLIFCDQWKTDCQTNWPKLYEEVQSYRNSYQE